MAAPATLISSARILKTSARISPGWDFGMVCLAYLFVFFLLCPGTPFHSFPVHHDDFANLSYTRVAWYPLRPVSAAAAMGLSVLGIPAYYAGLHVLVVAYVFLSASVLRHLLAVPRLPVLLLAPIAAAMLSYENTVEYVRFTGLITNLLSAALGTGAMSILCGTEVNRLDYKKVGAVWILAALSFWSKEDFVLPVLILAGYLTWNALAGSAPEKSPRWRMWLTMLAGLLVLAAALFLYNRHSQSPFTQAVAGPYKPNFTPRSLVSTAWTYIMATTGSEAAFLLMASALVWNCLAFKAVAWSRVLVFEAIIIAMALPYLVLPNHVAPYYANTWTVWQLGGALLLMWTMKPGVGTRIAVTCVAAVCIVVTQPGRAAISRWYTEQASVNRRVVNMLIEHSAQLQPYKTIAVEGAPMLGPWFGSGGEILRRRYYMDHQWLIRVPEQSDYMKNSMALLGTPVQGDVTTVATEKQPVPPGVPLIRLGPDGSGTLQLP